MSALVAVTGANGFVGSRLCSALRQQGTPVRALVRSAVADKDHRIVGDLGPETRWDGVLAGVDCLVHCAARVHVLNDTHTNPLEAFRAVNVEGTRALARAAAAQGVRRFVFLSSLKVMGETTPPGQPFQASDAPAPQDAYGVSKWEAEQALQDVALSTGLEWVIVRPPLVYGPGVKANFRSLMAAVARGIPLPLGAVDNCRSLLALDNLVDLLQICAQHPAAAGQVFLASDDHDLSTPELVRQLAHAMQRPARLMPVPVSWLRLAGKVMGRRAQIERLTGSLQVNIGHTKRVLGWAPRLTVEQGLRAAVQDTVR